MTIGFPSPGPILVQIAACHLLPQSTPLPNSSPLHPHTMDSHSLCHWYSQLTPESYVIDTPANVGRCLDSYIFDTSADTSWAKDLWCIQRAIQCPVVWHSDRPVCMGVYCWTRELCSVAFQWYNMHPFTFCKSSDMLHLIYSVPMLLDQPVGQFAEIWWIHCIMCVCVCCRTSPWVKALGRHWSMKEEHYYILHVCTCCWTSWWDSTLQRCDGSIKGCNLWGPV